jgi:hypothetical protein
MKVRVGKCLAGIQPGFPIGLCTGCLALLVWSPIREFLRHSWELHSRIPTALGLSNTQLIVVLAGIALAVFVRYGVAGAAVVRKIGTSLTTGIIDVGGLIWAISTFGASILLVNKHWFLGFLLLLVGPCLNLLVAAVRQESTYLPADGEPIDDETRDILERTQILGALESHIRKGTPVVALVGDFGDGKTSVLKMLENRLQHAPGIITVSFSSWLPGNEKTLAATLFTSIGRALGKRYVIGGINNSFNKYARIVVGMIPKLPTNIRDLLGDESQEKQIDLLRRRAAGLDKRVVVLLDEVDRMRAEELETLFKIVRGIPDFRNFTFICALQHSAIVRTLSRWPGDEAYVSEYIEKFFPHQIELSKIDTNILKEQFDKKLAGLIKEHNILPTPAEKTTFDQEIPHIWTKYLRRYFSNIRRLSIYFSNLNAIGDKYSELNLLDAMLLEALREISPNIYDLVYRYGYHWYYPKWDWDTALEVPREEQEELNRRRAFYKTLIASVPFQDRDVVEGLLGELFPKFSAYINGKTAPDPSGPNEKATKRIYHVRHFPQYFIHKALRTQFGVSELARFAQMMKESQRRESAYLLFKSTFEEISDYAKRLNFLQAMRELVPDINGDQALGIVGALSDLSYRFDPSEILGEYTEARVLIFILAGKFKGTPRALELIERVVTGAASDSFAAIVVFYLLHPDRNDFFKVDESFDIGKIKELYRQKMRSKYSVSSISAFATDKPSALSNLFRWAECDAEGATEVHRYVIRQLSTNPRYVGTLLNWTKMFGSFGSDELQSINKLIPIDELKRIIVTAKEPLFANPEEQAAVELFRKTVMRGTDEPRPSETVDDSGNDPMLVDLWMRIQQADRNLIRIELNNRSKWEIKIYKIRVEHDGVAIIHPVRFEGNEIVVVASGKTVFVDWQPGTIPARAFVDANKGTSSIGSVDIIADGEVLNVKRPFKHRVMVRPQDDGLVQSSGS